jgi:hypothetical protein
MAQMCFVEICQEKAFKIGHFGNGKCCEFHVLRTSQ